MKTKHISNNLSDDSKEEILSRLRSASSEAVIEAVSRRALLEAALQARRIIGEPVDEATLEKYFLLESASGGFTYGFYDSDNEQVFLMHISPAKCFIKDSKTGHVYMSVDCAAPVTI
jgi:hypothetical protein